MAKIPFWSLYFDTIPILVPTFIFFAFSPQNKNAFHFGIYYYFTNENIIHAKQNVDVANKIILKTNYLELKKNATST